MLNGGKMKSTVEWKEAVSLPENVQTDTLEAAISNNILTIVAEVKQPESVKIPIN